MNLRNLPSLRLLCLSLLLPVALLQADEVKLKSGQTITGRITYEADDIIKIEVPVSASIKETKVIGRADIAEVIKDAPDDVEFNRIQKLVPTAPLLPASAYRQILETGPDSFLKNFPTSVHAPKVKEIRDTLAGELDKVERGFMKLEDEWLSPQDKIDYKELIESRVRLASMAGLAQSPNFNGLIGAMREFDTIERNYFGSPAYPKAVELARQTLPILGRQLQTMLRDVDFRNAEYERALANSKPEAREKLILARQKEEKAFQDSLAADKKSGVKWVQLNPRVKASIEGYLKLATDELARMNGLDVATLTKQAELHVEADKLIAGGNIEGARTKLGEAAAITGETAATPSKSKSKSSSKGGSKGGASYIASLNNKINERTADEKSKAEARKAAADSEALTANLNKTASQGAKPEAPSPTDGTAAEATPEATDPAATTPAAPEVDDFAALAGSKKGSSKADAKEKDDKKTTSKKSKSKSSGDDDESEEDEDGKSKPRPAVVEEEGGFPLGLIVPIITVLLIVTVVLLKVFGVGGKKTEE